MSKIDAKNIYIYKYIIIIKNKFLLPEKRRMFKMTKDMQGMSCTNITRNLFTNVRNPIIFYTQLVLVVSRSRNYIDVLMTHFL
jgi:hypothetical protein